MLRALPSIKAKTDFLRCDIYAGRGSLGASATDGPSDAIFLLHVIMSHYPLYTVQENATFVLRMEYL